MCARFTVLSDTPIAAAIAGWAIPLSRNNTIWMRWRCAAGIFQRSAVLSRRTSALLHLAICLPRIRWRKRITAQGEETISSFRRLASKNTDSSSYGGGIRQEDVPFRFYQTTDRRIANVAFWHTAGQSTCGGLSAAVQVFSRRQ